jgi:hypothetical protein
MRLAECHLRSISAYSQSRAHLTERLNRETPDEFEKRTWREVSLQQGGQHSDPTDGFQAITRQRCVDAQSQSSW